MASAQVAGPPVARPTGCPMDSTSTVAAAAMWQSAPPMSQRPQFVASMPPTSAASCRGGAAAVSVPLTLPTAVAASAPPVMIASNATTSAAPARVLVAPPVVAPPVYAGTRVGPSSAGRSPYDGGHAHWLAAPAPLRRQRVDTSDTDFPYHDPVFGAGWRAHFPDELDERVLGAKELAPNATAFMDLAHQAFLRSCEVEMHAGEERAGFIPRVRYPPATRRVREPEC